EPWNVAAVQGAGPFVRAARMLLSVSVHNQLLRIGASAVALAQPEFTQLPESGGCYARATQRVLLHDTLLGKPCLQRLGQLQTDVSKVWVWAEQAVEHRQPTVPADSWCNVWRLRLRPSGKFFRGG